MKLKELIDKLQEKEKATPGTEVVFQTAEVTIGKHTVRTAHLFDMRGDAKECLITIGYGEGMAVEYRSQVAALGRVS